MKKQRDKNAPHSRALRPRKGSGERSRLLRAVSKLYLKEEILIKRTLKTLFLIIYPKPPDV